MRKEDCTLEGREVMFMVEPDMCAKSFDEFFNSLNCRLKTPIRCISGECKKYPFSMNNSDGCSIGISCPKYRPFLCADGSCVEKAEFCKSFSECPNGQILCFDRTCVDINIGCEAHKKCPAKNPVLCPNGNCVSGIFECKEEKCPKSSPYYCVIGECSKNPRECQKIEVKVENYDFMINIATVCKENEYTCLDGTCRENSKDCPIYQGCTTSGESFKCLDGGCAANKNECSNKNDAKFFDCPNNLLLCEDGICRKNCSLVEYNGCPNNAPLLCPNGKCVLQEIDCKSESACDSTEKPFRCIDGDCKASLAECKMPFREVGDTNINIYVYPNFEIDAELIIGPNNIITGKIEIPAGTITNKRDGSSIEAQISFRSVARSSIVDTYIEYDKTREDDLKSIYPYADPDKKYTLNYQYIVLSSVIEVNLKEENAEISGKILLTLLFDFPIKHEKLEKNKENGTYHLNYNKDVCLAKLDIKKRKWECTRLNFNVEAKSNLQLTGELKENGIYAVVLNLRMDDNEL